MQSFKNLSRVSLLAMAVAATSTVAPVGVPFLGAGVAEAAVVNNIVVNGATRIEDETVRDYLTIRPGQTFSAIDIDESLTTLYATGLFADVSIEQQGNTLVVNVQENPVINRISFEGNSRLNDQALESVIRSSERSMLTRARVQSDAQNILEAYRRSGRFRASVEPKIIERPNNRVDLVFEIEEGDKTGVARISFIGNQAFSDGYLREQIQTRESGFLGWLRTTDVYDPDRLEVDQEALRQFYYQKGYADFRVVSAVADLDREQNIFYVTFTVDEGDRYNFGDIEIDTSLSAIDPEAMRQYVQTKPGSTYNSLEVEKTLENLTLEVSKAGYAFAQVRPRGERDYEHKTVSITYLIEEGPRVYVERINVRGNDRTREYVIRREFDLAEGDAYNRILLDKAERRLRNTRYFEDVRITRQQGSAPDRVIINVDVVEQPTGEVSFGVGYSTSDGVIGDISISERNFLGRGQYVKAAVGGGTDNQKYEFQFIEPFFMGRRISAGLDVYRRVYEQNSTRAYDEQTTGGGFNFGLPLREDELTLNLFYKLFQRDLTRSDSTDIGNCAAGVSLGICDSLGQYTTSLVGTSLVYNTLDNNLNPRDGVIATVEQEFAGVGGQSQYLRGQVKASAFEELYPEWGLVGFVQGSGGYIEAVGNRLRVTDQFQGSPDRIRGFATNGYGPRDAVGGDAIGGKYYVAGTVEGQFPFPVVPEELGLSGAVFADAGSLWGVDGDLARAITTPTANSPAGSIQSEDFELRASVGFGVLWQSPFGPLRADFAWPLLKNDVDETQVFKLSGGTSF
ncbi:outer membrane protein assembly factor BamA [Pseudovibrio japonicus]|uniref:Outer membrane protein assembly factor BamA n=1 Tax=Pseudovibrio japonicus TaxID=366534 RepID=A0ABQ3EER4_9HYPH|nr:outer membrane protein assembly factor BamA [Pseudovibrio japonicus]GHB35498.1 outer membrane protein assembly factor BamA [Pseudovibrio japonicus]